MSSPGELSLALLLSLLICGLLLLACHRLLGNLGVPGAVARVLFKEGTRRGALPLAMLILFLGILALPGMLAENRIAEYRLQSLLQYGQSWISLVLMTLTVLLGCATLAEEIATRRLDVTLSKPAGRGRYLLGKWLGLIILDGVLLAVAMALLIFVLERSAGDGNYEAIPGADLVAQPLPPEVSSEEMAEYIEVGRKSDPERWDLLSEEEANQRAVSALLRSARSIPIGEQRQYLFDVPSQLPWGSRLLLRPYLGRSTHRSLDAVLTVRCLGTESVLTVGNAEIADMELPAGPVESPLGISITFNGAVEEGFELPAILWAGTDSIQLRVPEDSLAGNALRSSLMLWLRLAFTAALSTLAVTTLGFPVATLFLFIFLVTASTGSLLVIDEASPSAHDHSHQGEEVDDLADKVLHGLALLGESVVVAVSDWERHDTSKAVSTGTLIPRSEVIRALLVIGVLWTGVALVVARWLLRRRELGGASP